MTVSEFGDIFALLAKQLRQVDADEADIRAYFEALKDIEPEMLALAAKRLAVSGDWFPKTPEWRAAARDIDRERTDAIRAILRKLPTPLCLACDDTGWAPSSGEPRRVHPCACQRERRLEVLGRRPWPRLLSEPVSDSTQQTRVEALAVSLARRRGF